MWGSPHPSRPWGRTSVEADPGGGVTPGRGGSQFPCRAPGLEWHVPDTESVKVRPSTGRNVNL